MFSFPMVMLEIFNGWGYGGWRASPVWAMRPHGSPAQWAAPPAIGGPAWPPRLAPMDADALSTTPAAQAALEALRTAAGANGPMERHCLRQFAIAERLAG